MLYLNLLSTTLAHSSWYFHRWIHRLHIVLKFYFDCAVNALGSFSCVGPRKAGSLLRRRPGIDSSQLLGSEHGGRDAVSSSVI